MKPRVEEGQMLRIRLECLRLAVQAIQPDEYRRHGRDLIEKMANAFHCYVLTGAMQEPELVKPQYRPVEMIDAGDLQ